MAAIKTARIGAAQFPLHGADGAVAMAMIVGLTGPSFRSVGSTMFVSHDGRRTGSLSSGCIDADVVLHASAASDAGGILLRYGEGSPFKDIRLPCGGSMDVLLLPMPTEQDIRQLQRGISERQEFLISIGREGIAFVPREDDLLRLEIIPEPRFIVFGKGLEAATFSDLATNAGFDTILMTPDLDQVSGSMTSQLTVRPFSGPFSLDLKEIDKHTACVLFFHDRDVEPELIRHILQSQAFYIGAQGSLRTAASRIEKLRSFEIGDAETARVKGPIGLIPSTRDPRTLAVSVLAEILSEAQAQF